MKTKKLLSIILAFCMLFSVVPMFGITASAEAIDRTNWTKITDTITITEGGNYYLDSDVTASISVVNGITATIDLNGHTLTAGTGNCAIKINEGAEYYADTATDITIKDTSAEKTGKITTDGTAISHDGAGIYINSGKLSIYDITITNCHTTKNGGAVSVGALAQVLLDGCTLTDNSASGSGGAIYKQYGSTPDGENSKDPTDKLALIDTVITGNTAGEYGGGVYAAKSKKGSSCFTAGTLVTMANGSQKKVEEIAEGDLVKTFDHESGEFSTAKVYLSFAEQLKPQPVFALHFDNGTVLNCVASHTFLEKETRKYLEFDVCNAESYVGKSFFGEDGKWHKLESVTYPGSTEWLYEIYTEEHQNSFANGMLSCPADIEYLLNIYELDENLKADEAQLKADIEEYGLMSFETANSYAGGTLTTEWYKAAGIKYMLIVFGKGLYSLEEAKALYNSIQDTESDTQPKLKKVSAPLMMSAPLLTGNSNSPKYEETTLSDFADNSTYVGHGTKVYGNTVGSNANNVYLPKNHGVNHISLYNCDADTLVGITLETGTGIFVNGGASAANEAHFFSDNTEYADRCLIGTTYSYESDYSMQIVDDNEVTLDTCENGSVSVGKKSYYANDIVTITATPDTGYDIVSVSAYKTDEPGVEIEVIGNDFTMPNCPVTVKATFIKLPDTLSDVSYSASLTLSKNFDVNFKMNNINDDIEDKLSITVDDSSVDYEFENGVVACVLKAVEPKYIAKAIHIVITYDDTLIKDFNYTVKSYCNAVYNHKDFGENSKLGQLCTVILNYGKYAEDYANKNTASTINKGHELDLSGIVLPASKKVFTKNALYGDDGSSATLKLGSTVKLQYSVKSSYPYEITLVKDMENAKAIEDGKYTTGKIPYFQNFFIINEDKKQIDPAKVNVNATDEGCLISIDLYAYQLCNEYTLKVKGVDTKDFCITFGVYDYCTYINANDYNDTTKALCKCIYAYGEAVKAYVG